MRFFILSLLSLSLSGCSDLFAPKSPTLRVSVVESLVQPSFEAVVGDGFMVYRTNTRIDIEVTNLSASTIVFPTCGIGSTTPTAILERSDGAASPLEYRRVCAGGSEVELPAGETWQLSIEHRADLFCGNFSACPMAEPSTWGEHRLRLVTESGSTRSNVFYIRSPIIYGLQSDLHK